MNNMNMMLISSIWENQPTFRLIPTSLNCPYNEVIYDPAQKMLAILSKEKKESYHFLPKLDDNGDIQQVKHGKARPNKQPYQEQRVMLPTYYEYFISNPEEVLNFIKGFAVNSGTFNYTQYLSVVEKDSELDNKKTSKRKEKHLEEA